ncbi:acylase [Erythrobacter ani]|uniref:Acylase n=1 Tax=Erythrobacter ani TaxID=2827235 RepID=A0ABS6SIV8_9SPHN|nr:acylase [Erythrobacter ani]MBV7264929.1 acylase [Erythrobacter ani]
MRKWFVGTGIAVAAFILVAVIGLMTWEPFYAHRVDTPPPGEYSAEIIRSEYGVPHIYGDTDPDVAFGVAIAQSEDDFFTLQDVIAMSRGRYGAIAGEDGATFDYVYHLLDARGTAEREYPSLPEDTRALFEGYAAGLNQYAKDNPDEVKLANLFPVNGEDVAAGFVLRQPFFFGLANVIQPLVAGEPLRREFGPDIPGFPRDETGTVTDREEQAGLLHPLPIGDDAQLLGSNAWAVAPEKSGGPTTLISNSHQPLRGGVAWYELVVESGEGWHYAGANLPGTPYPVLGHNRNLGWTYTVNRPDLVDVYELEVTTSPGIDGDDIMYKLDDEWLKLDAKTVTLPVKMGPVTLPIRRTIYRSVHGPVIKNDNGYFAIRYGGMDSVRPMDAFYRLGKSQSMEEWLAVYERLDIPNFNAVYADAEGNIAYIYNAAFPDRPEQDEVKANWRGVLPGNRSDLIWEGTVEFDEIPKLINPESGWLYNANNEPFTAAGEGSDLNPDHFSPILGVERKQTNRSRRAYKLLSEASLLDRETLKRIKYDTAYERVGYVDDLFSALETLEVEGDLAEARDLLLTWDFKADNKGGADALALLMIRDFMSAEYQNRATPDVREKLRDAVDHLNEHFGRIDPPMSDLLRLRQGDVDLPLDGGSDTLRASTTWQVDEDGRLGLVHGDSFIQWVEWHEGERVTSRSIQPFGAAITRPDSPHHTDQMQLFVDHELKPVHFWREDVIANAKRRYTVTNAE